MLLDLSRALSLVMLVLAQSAMAAVPGAPIRVTDTLTLDPIIDTRLRYETVSENKPLEDARALTLRTRAGFEAKSASGLSLLAEAEATLALVDRFNSTTNGMIGRSVVPDPESVELNRLQIGWKTQGIGLTLGRQRINLDDQRFVGSVAWRQNEQTFDAVRLESAGLGPVVADLIYARSQRSIFGSQAGPRTAFDGDFWLLNAGVVKKSFTIKAFAYLIEMEEAPQFANSSATYGVRATGQLPLGKAKLDMAGSYARQSDRGSNPNDYAATYLLADAGVTLQWFKIAAAYEKLGGGTGSGFRTPFGTNHKFQGWADLFLTTPADGVTDLNGTIALTPKTRVKGLTGLVTYHRFRSDIGGRSYGTEWDAQIGARFGQVSLLAKFADYRAAGFGADTRKFWLQADLVY